MSAPDLSTVSIDIAAAVSRLRAGGQVALPTETVYGVAADACNDQAVAGVFALKGRPSFNPLIVHVSDVAMAMRYVEWNETADKLAQAFWPGALTLVLPRRADCPVSLLCSAGGDTLAIRCPAHPIVREVIEQFGGGLAAPSANRSGRISPTHAVHVLSEFGDKLAIVDGGQSAIGIESTVVDCTGVQPALLRHGSITERMLNDLGIRLCSPAQSESGELKSPGMLSSHYAPSIALRTHATHVNANEALLAFGAQPLSGAAAMLNLSEQGDLTQAAANLFAHLRALDDPSYTAIAVMPIPDEGVGRAINDRLKRAAAKRD